jgi:2-hydroxy-3-oxopropionate reductase
MVGGSTSTLEKVVPILKAMGKTITRVGDMGRGQIAKAANQIRLTAQTIAMSELFDLCPKTGSDPQKVIEAIRGGAAQCWTLVVKPPRLFKGNCQPSFKAQMQAKDMNIIF